MEVMDRDLRNYGESADIQRIYVGKQTNETNLWSRRGFHFGLMPDREINGRNLWTRKSL